MGHEGEFRYLKVNKGVKWNKCVGRDDNPIIIKRNSEQKCPSMNWAALNGFK